MDPQQEIYMRPPGEVATHNGTPPLCKTSRVLWVRDMHPVFQHNYITDLRTVRLGLAFDVLCVCGGGGGGQVALSKPRDTQGLLPTMELFPGSSMILSVLFSHQEWEILEQTPRHEILMPGPHAQPAGSCLNHLPFHCPLSSSGAWLIWAVLGSNGFWGAMLPAVTSLSTPRALFS